MKLVSWYLCIIFFCSGSFAQTGPGGVGNSTNNVLWLDASSGVFSDAGVTPAVSTNNVAQWNDRSGNTRNASQSTAGNRPNYQTGVINGNPVVRYTSTNGDRMIATGLNSSNSASVWAVAAYSSLPSTNPGILQASPSGLATSGGGADKTIGLWVNSGAGTRVWGRGVQSNSTQQSISQVTTLNASTFYIINNMYRSNRIDQYVNNAAAGNNTTHNGTLRSWTDVAIGSQANESWNGDIAEIIMFNIEVNSAQRIIIDNYLAAKYARTLSSNDVYQQDNAGNGDFDHEVAGIGRVDASNIHNDAQGSGIIRILNPTNLNNNEFMMWGHNGAILQATETGDIPGSMQARFARVWRVSEVNAAGTAVNVGNVDIRFNLTGLGAVTTSDLRLLIDTDNDGVFSDETPIGGASSLGGNVYEFQNVSQLTNGVRFTLGTVNTNQTPLPIQLVFFEAKLDENRNVELEWRTQTELNNDFFTVERSLDGIHWSVISYVPSKGNSTSIKYYFSLDENPLLGLSYYRIKQTDFDGSFTYSPIRVVNLNHFNDNLLVYPNPTSDNISLSLPSYVDEFETVVYNVNGQQCLRFVNQNELDLSILPSGIYFLQIHTKEHVYKRKLIKN